MRPPARFLSGLDNLQIARFNFKINYKSWIKMEWQSTLLYSVKQIIHILSTMEIKTDRKLAKMDEYLRSQAFRLLREEWREYFHGLEEDLNILFPFQDFKMSQISVLNQLNLNEFNIKQKCHFCHEMWRNGEGSMT